MSAARPGRRSEARSAEGHRARPAGVYPPEVDAPSPDAPAARLADATWPEVDARAAAGPTTLLIPLGATEQHGPHLPIGTDATIAVALADGAAAEVPGAVVAPALAYGSSGEHQDFAGTLSIGAAATELLLVELGRSATETFPRVLFVNAHGGNAVPLAAAVRRLRAESRDVRAWSPDLGGDAHAGRTETSLMLALELELELEPGSATDRAATAGRGELAEVGNTAPLVELIGELRAGGVRAVSANGVLGDPTGASAEEGRELLAAAIGDLRAALVSWPALGAPARTRRGGPATSVRVSSRHAGPIADAGTGMGR